MPIKKLSHILTEEKLFFSAFHYAAIGMALVSLDGKWLMVNKALCSLIGYNENELLQLTFQDITHPDDLEEDLQYVNKMLSGELETYQMEKRYFHKDGTTIHILLSVSLVKDENASNMFFISQIQDITDRKLLEDELVRQATEDALTGIFNRRRFYDLADRDIIHSGRYNDPIVILMIDIDYFKKINDTFGHSVGDDALKRMAAVCRSELRTTDIFGRIGGEEFGVLMVKTDAITGRQVAERLRRSVEQSIMTTDKGVLKFTISIGGVAFSGNERSLEYRLNQADEALYKAKSKGRNQTVLMDTLDEEKGDSAPFQAGFLRLEWNKAYECGNKKIDEQHRNLFISSNMLLAAMIDQREKDLCIGYLEQLISDVSDHFKTEESLMKALEYPHIKEHKHIHRKLSDKALQMEKSLKNAQLDFAELFQFITVKVISQHMLDEDQKFFTFLKYHQK